MISLWTLTTTASANPPSLSVGTAFSLDDFKQLQTKLLEVGEVAEGTIVFVSCSSSVHAFSNHRGHSGKPKLPKQDPPELDKIASWSVYANGFLAWHFSKPISSVVCS